MNITLAFIAEALRSGRVTLQDYIEHSCARIGAREGGVRALNKKDPPEADKSSNTLDYEMRLGG
jgi:hypothetical protein